MALVRSSLTLLLAAPLFGADSIASGTGNTLVAHEWGTFTTVTEASGKADVWGALAGKADLPCFVIRQPHLTKVAMFTRVRMETPVVYFYSRRPATVSLQVRFPAGVMTEWYPNVLLNNSNALYWKDIQVLPDEDPEFPGSNGDSHYYAARETDSAPLRVGDQQEKLLFYRGTGDFQPPASPRFTALGMVEVRGVRDAVLFENRGGKIGWRVVHGPDPVAPPELTGNLDSLRSSLVDMLTAAGLYQKEARAMVETWRDSWFEEGMRLLYLVPREFIDRVLPLEITPRPREVSRVFMGRAELLSPEHREALARALAAGDMSGFESYGRFFTAFARQVTHAADPSVSMKFIIAKEQEIAAQSGACVR
jgi:hypothetical protein